MYNLIILSAIFLVGYLEFGEFARSHRINAVENWFSTTA